MEAKGYHFFLDGTGCNPKILNDLDYLEEMIKEGCETCNLDLRKICSYRFKPQGVSIVGIIGESHISLHTYPEDESFMLDVFHCGDDDSKAKLFVEYVTRILNPIASKVEKIHRTAKINLYRETTVVSEE